jgi:hypothetical protein
MVDLFAFTVDLDADETRRLDAFWDSGWRPRVDAEMDAWSRLYGGLNDEQRAVLDMIRDHPEECG